MIDHLGRFKGAFVPADDLSDIGTTDKPVRNIVSKAATVTGTLTASGGVTGNITGNVTGNVTGSATKMAGVNLAVATPKIVTAAESGQVFVGVVDCAFTLPTAAAAGNGAYYTFITGVASAGTGLTITRSGSDTIDGVTGSSLTPTAITNATSLTNSGASDVKGDYVTLVSDGVSKWLMINVVGTWA